ncbi:MAG: hypothetical protein JNK23_12200 [Opitutaceae bacterium]|nr:hypothetical protein [Opitutaceae bacterium]
MRATTLFLALLIGWLAPARATDSGPRAATPAEVTLLNDALYRVAGEYPRWAYTEHRIVRDSKGRVKTDLVLRFDPSRPYAEQWTPIQVNGKEPSARDRAKYRAMGERAAPADMAKPAQPKSDLRRRVSLGELLDVAGSSIADETATHWTFEIPLRKFGNERFPPEKFRVLVRLRKEGEALENIAVRLRESFRSKFIVSVKSGEGTLEFSPVDPKRAPALVGLSGDAVASVLFVNVGGSVTLTRTDLKAVKPYDERFEVQIGNLKAIDF